MSGELFVVLWWCPCAAFAASALFSARRFLVAAMIAALPAADNLRFSLGAAFGADDSAAFLDAAHLLRCASAIALLPATLILRRFRGATSGVTAGAAGPPDSIAWSSAILARSFSFWASIPKIAAFTISVVSFGAGMLLDLPQFFHRKGHTMTYSTLTMILEAHGTDLEYFVPAVQRLSLEPT